MSDMLVVVERSAEMCVGLRLRVTPENKREFCAVTYILCSE